MNEIADITSRVLPIVMQEPVIGVGLFFIAVVGSIAIGTILGTSVSRSATKKEETQR